MNSAYISRINQWDALQLDEEIYKILQTRIREIATLFSPSIVDTWNPEINAILKTLMWIFSLTSGKSTFGQRLLDLTYANLTKKKAVLLLFMSVISKYLEDKYLDPNKIMINDGKKRIKKYLEKIEIVINLLSFLNLLVFLHRGCQPTLLERIVNISSRNVATQKPRTIGYSYITRELLWHGLMELFIIGLPMVNFHCLKRHFLQFWHRSKNIITNPVTTIMTNCTKCPYCKQSPIIPSHADCGHIYCYYCIAAHFTATDNFNCIACGVELHSHKFKIYSAIH